MIVYIFSFLFLSGILSVIRLFYYLRELSIKIMQLRDDPKAKYDFLLEASHHFPVPYFKEYNDTEEVIKIIRRRNLFTLFFWLAFISLFLLGFLGEKYQ